MLIVFFLKRIYSIRLLSVLVTAVFNRLLVLTSKITANFRGLAYPFAIKGAPLYCAYFLAEYPYD